MRRGSWVATIAAIACTGSTGAPPGGGTGDPPGQAAAPTFSPAAGLYASAQTVTIASATGGAVVRCTQDGSTPTDASPTCAAPVVVSSTRTLRAVATAPGLAPSAVASATYTIDAATTAEKLQAFSTRRSWFAHRSVGDDVYHGAAGDDASGLARIVAQNAASGCTTGDLYLPDEADLTAIPAGRWADSLAAAPNGDPVGKLDGFAASLGGTFGGGLDYAGLKLCFTDADTAELAQAAWDRYPVVMDRLEAAFPGRLVFWTVPLTADEGANVHREWLSSRIRERYGSTGRVFDIADWESRDAGGALVLGANGVRTLDAAWSASDQSHLSAAGADEMARRYLDFMYALEAGKASAAAAGGRPRP